MIFKTTQKMNFGVERGIVNNFIFIEVIMPLIGEYTVQPRGGYFYKDENSNKIILLDFSEDVRISWEDIKTLENNATLESFSAGIGIHEALLKRIEEMTLIRIDKEYAEDSTTNWGIHSGILEKQ